MKLYQFILNLGIQKGLKGIEIKRVKLLNAFAFSWFIMELFLIGDSIVKYAQNPSALYMHCFNAVNIVVILLLQYNYKTKLAQIYFLVIVLISNVVFSNFIIKDPSIKLFFIIIPALSVLFIDNQLVNIAVLILSYTFFSLPSYSFNTIPSSVFDNNILTLCLFLCIFLIVNFLKNINAKSESLLLQKQIELEHQNNFQSQFFINISHEIKTPITLIKAETNNLESIPGTKEIKKRIELQNSKIIKIVDDVIDLAKMKSSNFELALENIDISKPLQEIHASFTALFQQKEIAFSFSESNETIYIKADLLFLTRAINNLVLNAFKYTPKKGEVSLKSYVIKDMAYIEVTDSGIGISENDFSNIFKQFYQIDNTYNTAGGSGIGLFFTKQIVNLHKGEIKLKSSPNKGSTFSIEIPTITINQRAHGTNKEFINNQKLLLTTNTKNAPNQNILVIDDSFEMRRYLKSILKEYNYFEAADGKEALELLAQQDINCIVCDYMMPIIDGPTFVSKLKETNSMIPVLMLTAKNDRESKLNLLKLGVAEYMAKPFDEEELLIRIDNILNRQGSKNNFIKENNIDFEEQKASNSWINSVKAYLLDNISDNEINQLDLAFHFNLSKSTFYRRIKASTGLTPKEFITEIKLQEAKRLIEIEGIDTIKVVAYEVGYLQAHYFSKLYFKRFGIKPIN